MTHKSFFTVPDMCCLSIQLRIMYSIHADSLRRGGHIEMTRCRWPW